MIHTSFFRFNSSFVYIVFIFWLYWTNFSFIYTFTHAPYLSLLCFQNKWRILLQISEILKINHLLYLWQFIGFYFFIYYVRLKESICIYNCLISLNCEDDSCIYLQLLLFLFLTFLCFIHIFHNSKIISIETKWTHLNWE